LLLSAAAVIIVRTVAGAVSQSKNVAPVDVFQPL